ncbi:hypothetical protein [Nereida sp. MMG025]|uniref:hypothetical protein n=1 Tax=Nereida sp. MMG025 TaxID=2909981 RepID=UPI001F27F3A5|nr:hypothetical protein [Nereida sp. MMG025]
MAVNHEDTLDEDIASAFVVACSLYFRLAILEPPDEPLPLLGWQAALHDTARNLAALSDSKGPMLLEMATINRAARDLVTALKDLSQIAADLEHTKLRAELNSYAEHLEAQIDRSNL